MPSSIKSPAVPTTHLADVPMSEWQHVPGTEHETVLKSPRGNGTAEPVSGAPMFPSHWRRLFPVPGEASTPDSSSDSALGVALGHFTIERRIGAGAMGAVFLAHDERLHRPVALKVLSPSQTADPSTVLRFQHEAQAAARLDHDHIARVFYSGEECGLHFIAYEFVEGINLRDHLRQRGRLSPQETVNYAIQIATALRHTSRHGVVHRDIKPSNIIVDAAGRTKLVDLGLAKRDNVDAAGELTVAGTTLGTFDYISPEQARDPRTVDVRSDIYSLGCTMYHLLTGEPPYPEGTVLQKLLDHQAQHAPDASAKNRRVSPALSAVIRKMMSSEASKRYATPDELLRDLAVIARSLGLRMVSPDSAALVPASRLRGSWWDRNFGWILTAAALVLIAAGMQYIPQLRDRFAEWTTNNIVSAGNPSPSVSTLGDAQSYPPFVDGSQAATHQAAATGDGKKPPPVDRKLPEKSSSSTPDSFAPPSAAVAVDTARATMTPATSTGDERLPEISILGSKITYTSLEQACQDAKDGAIIELAYHGSRAAPEQALRLSNKKIVIRAAKNFRPRLDFTDGNQSASRIIVVAGGSLQLVNVDVVAHVGSTVTGNPWTLFVLERPESLKLDGVTITIVNPKRRLAHVMELTSASSSAGTSKAGFPMSPPEIHVDGSIIRGAATLLSVREAVAARCTIKDSIVALDETLVTIQARPTMNGGEPGALKLELSHATTILGGSLIVSKPDENLSDSQLPLVVAAQNNLISVGPAQALVDLAGGNAMELRDSFTWVGERNFYHEIKAFWMIRSRQGLAPEPLNFAAWKEYWKSDRSGTENAPIRWIGNIRTTPLHELSLADVALATSGGPNPAIGAATDGSDLGAPLDSLPMPPRTETPK